MPSVPRECVCGRTTAARCAECGGRRPKVYEAAVRDVLERHEETRGFAWNRRVRGLRLRPDFVWVFERACVVLEVDEGEHAAYDAAREAARERAIAAALGRPVRYVRLRVKRGAPVAAVVEAAEALVPKLAARLAEAGAKKVDPCA
jgi:very-short-patch-repair endonuclease